MLHLATVNRDTQTCNYLINRVFKISDLCLGDAIVYWLAREVVGSSPAGRGRSRSIKQPWASCSLHPGPGLTQPSILSRSVNEYRLRWGKSKAGTVCATLLCARNVSERLCGGIVYLEAL